MQTAAHITAKIRETVRLLDAAEALYYSAAENPSVPTAELDELRTEVEHLDAELYRLNGWAKRNADHTAQAAAETK